MSKTTDPKTPNFEASLAQLEQVVEKLESGDLSLDDSLVQFQKGMNLSKSCQKSLDEAQLKVDALLNPEDPDSGQPFESDD